MTGNRLTSTPVEISLSRLSRELYDAFLHKAVARDYRFVRFGDFLDGGASLPERFIALRHDIDFAPDFSARMAEIEHDAGVVSTYFVLVDGHFYDPLRPETVRLLRHIRDLGHEIGLHFAVSSALDANDLGSEVAFRIRVLEAIVQAPVRSFAQHEPVNAGFATVTLPPGHATCVDASRAIRDHDLLYVSDSAMKWRQHTFDSALDEERNLCLLAHPHSWLDPQDDYVAMIREFESREVAAITQRYDTFVEALGRYYQRRLEEGV